MKQLIKALLMGATASVMAMALVACSGDDAPVPAASAVVSGTVVKGPITGATVTIYAVDSAGVKGAVLATTTTGAGGTYNATVAYTGPVLVEVTGGTYVDEATGATRTLSDPMRVMVTTTAGGTVTGVVTPLTTAAYSLGQVGGTGGAVNIATYGAAITSIATQFNLTGINLVTSVPSVTGTLNTYGQMLRAVSQYVANGGSLNTFFTWSSPTAFQALFNSAYLQINGLSITLTFNNTSVITITPGAGGSSAGSCGVSVSGSGTYNPGSGAIPFTLPPTKVCITGLGSASCSGSNSALNSQAQGSAVTGPGYSLTYTYSYSPGDCSGAIYTVNYMP